MGKLRANRKAIKAESDQTDEMDVRDTSTSSKRSAADANPDIRSKRARKPTVLYQAPESLAKLIKSNVSRSADSQDSDNSSTTNQTTSKKTNKINPSASNYSSVSKQKTIPTTLKAIKAENGIANSKTTPAVKVSKKNGSKATNQALSAQTPSARKKIKPKKLSGISQDSAPSTSSSYVSSTSVSKKPKLVQKLQITQYKVNPMFHSKMPIPFISTLVQSRLLIRAVALKDDKLLETLVKDRKQVCSLCMPKSVMEECVDAFYVAVKNDNRNAMKILLSVKNKDLAPAPKIILETQETGRGSYMMFGHAMRTVTTARGGKEGNSAFLKDTSLYYSDARPVLDYSRLLQILSLDISMETLIYLISLNVSKTKSEDSVLRDAIYNVDVVLKSGNCKLALELIENGVSRGGFGFNDLHKLALTSSNVPLNQFKGVSVSKKATDGANVTPIHCAAINPNPYYLENFLNMRPEYIIADSRGWTPLHYAAVSASDKNLKFLISRGVPRFQVERNNRNTPLHLAVICGNLRNVRFLVDLDKKDSENNLALENCINKTNKHGKLPLHLAAQYGNDNIFQALVSGGADVNKPTTATAGKLTPFMLACCFGHLDHCKMIFQKYNINLEAKDNKGRTALSLAVISGQAHIASWLLRIGANEKTADTSGNTLVHYAAAYGCYFSLKLLFQAGCDPNARNHWKMTPLAAAFMKGHLGIVDILLKEHSVDINSPVDDETGMTLLHKICSAQPDPDISEKLQDVIERLGADPNKCDFKHNHALHFLIRNYYKQQQRGHVNNEEKTAPLLQAFKYLLDRGVELQPPDVGNSSGYISPIMLSLSLELYEVTEILIKYPSQHFFMQDCDGNTFLHYVAQLPPGEEVNHVMTQCLNSDALSMLKRMTLKQNKRGMTPLMTLLNSNFLRKNGQEKEAFYVELVNIFIEDLECNAAAVLTHEDLKESCLHLAIASKLPVSVIRILIQSSSLNIDFVNGQGMTPLALALSTSDNAEVSKMLIRQGADITFFSENLMHPLVYTASLNSKQYGALQLMVRDLNPSHLCYQDAAKGRTVLHNIVMNSDALHALDCAKIILKCGLDVNATDFESQTPLHYAIRTRSGCMDECYDMEELLINSGAKLDLADSIERTPLHYAVLKDASLDTPDESFNRRNIANFDPIDLVMFLVEAMKKRFISFRSILHAKDFKGRTVLHYAAEAGCSICCTYLLGESKELLEMITDAGNTALAVAVRHQKKGCCLACLQHDANILVNSFNEDFDIKSNFLIWEVAKVQKEEIERAKRISSTCPVIEDVVHLDWQGILYLMVANMRISRLGIGEVVKAAIRRGKSFNLALKLMRQAKNAEELTIHLNNKDRSSILHVLCQIEQPSLRSGSAEDAILEKLFQSILDHGINVNQVDENGSHAVIYACINHSEQVLSLLNNYYKKKRKSIFKSVVCDNYGRNPFTALFWNLDDTTPINVLEKIGTTFLKEGANPNILCRYPIALLNHPGRSFVNLHQDSRFFCSQFQKRISPLILCIIKRCYSATHWLCQLPGDQINLNFPDEDGLTPLMHAIRINDVKSVRILLNHKKYDHTSDRFPYDSYKLINSFSSRVDVMNQDKNGWNALDHLVVPMKKELHYVHFKNIFDILIAAKAKVFEKSGDNTSPFERAIAHNRFDVIEYVLRKHAPPMKVDVNFPNHHPCLFKPIKEINQKILVEDMKESAILQKNKMLEKIKAFRKKDEDEVKPAPQLKLEEKFNARVLIDTVQKVPFHCILTKVDVSHGVYGIYNYYKMQVVSYNRGQDKQLILFTQWARVGDTGQYQKTPFNSEEECIKEFKKIFKTKTGNDWDELQNFKHLSKKYRLIDSRPISKQHEVYVDIKLLKESSKKFNSSIRSDVYKMVKEICLHNAKLFYPPPSRKGSRYYRRNYQDVLLEAHLPFGMLSEETMKRAEEILNELLKILKEQTATMGVNLLTPPLEQREKISRKIVTLSEEFYGLVPLRKFTENVILPMDSENRVTENLRLLHDLSHIDFSKEVLLSAEYNASLCNPFDYVYYCLNARLERLDENIDHNVETELILQYIHNTRGSCSAEVEGVYRIHNNQSSQFPHGSNVWLLWHGTKISHVLPILDKGLRVAPLGANLSGDMFGKGIYFADMFEKSQKYCDSLPEGNSFMFLCEVNLGRVKNVTINSPENEDLEPGEEQFDSVKTIDSRFRPDPGSSVCWKGCHIPLGQKTEAPPASPKKNSENSIENIHRRWSPNHEDDMSMDESVSESSHNSQCNTPRYGLDFNEYVVKDEKNVNLRYLIHFKC